MPVIHVDFSQLDSADPFANSKEALDLILGPPGEGAFATSPGSDETNLPGFPLFYRNNREGRQRYLSDAGKWTSRGRNVFFSSVVWEESALAAKGSGLAIGGKIQPLRFPALWCDVDKGTTEKTRELLQKLNKKSTIFTFSGGKTTQGKPRFHLRIPLDKPVTDLQEFYTLNQWLSSVLGGEKYNPVSWLTLPGSVRFKSEYPAGSPVKLQISSSSLRWSAAELKELFASVQPEPGTRLLVTGGVDIIPEVVPKPYHTEVRSVMRQKDMGDGSHRYMQTHKLIKLCAEHGYTKGQALTLLQQHNPTVGKAVNENQDLTTHCQKEIGRCWPEPKNKPVVAAASDDHDESSLLASARNGEWLRKQEFPPLEWAVQDVIPEGLGMIVAPPKAGKSWLVANIGLACASGGKTLNSIDVTQRPVLYMALEDSHRRLQERFTHLMGGRREDIPAALWVMLECEPSLITATILEFLEKNAVGKPLVVVDTLGKARGAGKGKNEDSYSADYAFATQLKNAVDHTPGASLLMVHHTRKAESSDFVDSASGTQGIAGAMDFILALQRKRQESEALLHLTGRDVEENSFSLTFDRGLWALNGKDLEAAARRSDLARLGDRARDILDYVESQESVTIAEVAEQLDISARDASTYLRRLEDRELIARKGRGVYMRVLCVV